MATLLWGNFLTGAVVVEDSREIPQLITGLAEGLNGTIAYTFESYERRIKVEFRSQTAIDTVFTSIRTNTGSLTYDGRTYLVKSIDQQEHFDSDTPVWTYELVLYRD